LARMGRNIDAGSERALIEVGRVVQTEARKNTPTSPTRAQASGTGYRYKIGRVPGTLRNSIELIKGSSRVTVGVVHGASLKYAERIDRGGYKLGPGNSDPVQGPHYIDRAWDKNEAALMKMYTRFGIDPAIRRFAKG